MRQLALKSGISEEKEVRIRGTGRASVYELSHSFVSRRTSILFYGQWSRLVNGCTKCNQNVTDSACI